MKRLFVFLCFVAVVVLFLTGYTTFGLAGAFIWIMFRINSTDARLDDHSMVTHNLLQILASDISAEEKAQKANSYIDEVNAVRHKQRNDWLFRLQNFGLAEDDPRRVH
jgi:hypothetical protein